MWFLSFACCFVLFCFLFFNCAIKSFFYNIRDGLLFIWREVPQNLSAENSFHVYKQFICSFANISFPGFQFHPSPLQKYCSDPDL